MRVIKNTLKKRAYRDEDFEEDFSWTDSYEYVYGAPPAEKTHYVPDIFEDVWAEMEFDGKCSPLTETLAKKVIVKCLNSICYNKYKSYFDEVKEVLPQINNALYWIDNFKGLKGEKFLLKLLSTNTLNVQEFASNQKPQGQLGEFVNGWAKVLIPSYKLSRETKTGKAYLVDIGITWYYCPEDGDYEDGFEYNTYIIFPKKLVRQTRNPEWCMVSIPEKSTFMALPYHNMRRRSGTIYKDTINISTEKIARTLMNLYSMDNKPW